MFSLISERKLGDRRRFTVNTVGWADTHFIFGGEQVTVGRVVYWPDT
jgi:hypothetical protein